MHVGSPQLKPQIPTFSLCFGQLLGAAWVTLGKKLIASTSLSPVVHKEIIDGHVFSQYSKKMISETLCINWERQCGNGELLQVRQRSVNVIEMTICVYTINGVIRIKNSTCL